MSASLKRGDRLPDIELVDSRGEKVRLSSFLGKGPIVLFFYPKDNTPICTKESCAFRDRHEEFANRGAVVLGISSDPADSHRAFAAAHQLPYALLSDVQGSARKAFGVPSLLGLLPGRATYVADKEGAIVEAYTAHFKDQAHVDRALAAVKTLAGS